MEYRLAGFLACPEVLVAGVEVVQLQGGSVVQRNVICPVTPLTGERDRFRSNAGFSSVAPYRIRKGGFFCATEVK